MYSSFVRAHRTLAFLRAVRATTLAQLLVTLLLSSAGIGQIVRPGPGDETVPGVGGMLPGGGGILPGGGGGVIIPINPILPINPGGGGINTGPRIVTDIGILTGQSAQASVVTDQQSTAAAPGQTSGGSTPATASTYQWTISG